MKIRYALLFLLNAVNCWGDASLREGSERFYYQAEWGTPSPVFELLRTGENGLIVKASAAGKYSFRDDGANVDGVVKISADWSGVQSLNAVLVITDQRGNQWRSQKSVEEGRNQWSAADFKLAVAGAGGRVPVFGSDLYKLAWELQTDGPAEAVLKNCQITLNNGTTYSLFADSKTPPAPYLPRLVQNADLPPSDPVVPRVVIAENSVPLAREDWQSGWNQWAHREFPGNFGVDFNGTLHAGLGKAIRSYREAGHFAIFETHLVPNQLAWVRNHKLSATRYDGFTPDTASNWQLNSDRGVYNYHGADTTREAVYEIVKDRMESAFDLGFDSYLIMDYIWPYFGGKWGYGESALQLWKEYVKGEGRTLDLDGPKETWNFGNYWAAFSSIPLVPESFGWKNWDEFTCGREAGSSGNPLNAKRLQLFNALWHYHHLVFLDRLSRDAEQRGKELSISVNPEDINNGDDFTLMARLRHLGSMGIEVMANPKCLTGLRHTLAPLQFRDGGPKIDLVGEINGGGHGPSRYDRDTSYAFYYDATAAYLPRHYNNQYLETFWPKLDALSPKQLARFDHWFAGANAFMLRHQEVAECKISRPDVTVIASRSVLEYQDSSSHSLGQEGNIAPYLHASNIEFEQVGRDAWKAASDTHTRTLFFSPTVATPGQRGEVKKWIESGEGKTLVLHGASAWKSDHSPDQPSVSAVVWSANRSYRDDLQKLVTAGLDETLIPLADHKEGIDIHCEGDTLKSFWWEPKAGSDKHILFSSDDGLPIVTEWQAGKNRIICINVDFPSRNLSEIGVKALASISDQAGLHPFARRLKGWSLNRWIVPGGNSVTAWNLETLTEQGKKNNYERVDLNPVNSATLLVKPDTDYTILSLFDQKTHQAKSNGRGELTVEIGHAPEVIYYGCDSPEFRATLSQVSKTMISMERRTRQ